MYLPNTNVPVNKLIGNEKSALQQFLAAPFKVFFSRKRPIL